MKTNHPNIKSDETDVANSRTVFTIKLNKKIANFANTSEGPSTQELKDCMKNLDKTNKIMFAKKTRQIDVFESVEILKIDKAFGIGYASAEVLQLLLLVIVSILTDFITLSLSLVWFPKCLKVSKVFALHKLCVKMNIIN